MELGGCSRILAPMVIQDAHVNFVSGSVIGKVGRREVLSAAAVSLVMVLCLDLITNSLDIGVFHWDHDWYIDMARHGFASEMLTAPFAYRFGTPLLAGGLHAVSGLSLEWSFRLIAYAGAVLQLTGLYCLLRWLGGSVRHAAVAVLIVAVEPMHLRFLLFDVYRPDHLSFAFMLLCTWLAWRDRTVALIVATVVGLQFREFVFVPMLAHAVALLVRHRSAALPRVAGMVMVVGAVGVLLPRVLIPVDADLQMVPLNSAGPFALVTALTNMSRMGNVLLAVLSYGLPLLLLATPSRLRSVWESDMLRTRGVFIGTYALLVVLLTQLGGSDMTRFTTYLSMPMAVLLVLVLPMAGRGEQVIAVLCVLVMGRVFLPIPQESLTAYHDFIGPYGDAMPWEWSLWRIGEIAIWVGIAAFVRHIRSREA